MNLFVATSLYVILIALVSGKDFASQHEATRRSLQICLSHIADLVHPPSFASAQLKASAVKPTEFVAWDDAWAKQRPTYKGPTSEAEWKPGEPDAAGLRDAPFWRFSTPASDTTRPQRKCREWIRGFGDRQQVLRDVFGVTTGMFRLGVGGTDGNIDVGSTKYFDPPVHEHSTRITESVAVHFGPSLARSAFILTANLVMGPFVRPGWEQYVPLPVNKAKSVMERSASFFDAATNHTHIVRVRWMANLYMSTFELNFDAYVTPLFLPHRTHVETEPYLAGGRVGTTSRRFPLHGVTLAYLVMNGGEWDMQFMAAKKIPGMVLETGERRNATAGIMYWSTFAPKAAAKVAQFVQSWSTSPVAVPVIWKEQPLPRCSSHRYATAKKAPMKCTTVMRPVIVPAFRRIAAEAFRNASSVVMPMDFLVEPNAPPDGSSVGLPSRFPPPPWYNATEEHPMCWLGDGIHLPFECTWLELQVIWATAVAWRRLFDRDEPALDDATPTMLPTNDSDVGIDLKHHVVGGTRSTSSLSTWRAWLPADMEMPAAMMVTLWVAVLIVRSRSRYTPALNEIHNRDEV